MVVSAGSTVDSGAVGFGSTAVLPISKQQRILDRLNARRNRSFPDSPPDGASELKSPCFGRDKRSVAADSCQTVSSDSDSEEEGESGAGSAESGDDQDARAARAVGTVSASSHSEQLPPTATPAHRTVTSDDDSFSNSSHSDTDCTDSEAQRGERRGSVGGEREEQDGGSEKCKCAGEEGGFTVLEGVQSTSRVPVHRVLPPWLLHPSLIGRHQPPPVSECSFLPAALRDRLLGEGVTRLFPVQAALLPHLLTDSSSGSGGGAFLPRDLCVSAPTGSGKTLAFVLPLLTALHSGGAAGPGQCCAGGCRVAARLRALVVLPTHTLAAQVAAVFRRLADPWSGLRVALLGEQSLARERARLVAPLASGGATSGGEWRQLVDIVVSTPGRLVDHITGTEGFSLRHLRYLVIDEADRVLEMAEAGWLRAVEAAAAAAPAGACLAPPRRPWGHPLTAASVSGHFLPLQKLLFSATLSQNAEKLATLRLLAPVLFVSEVSAAPAPVATTTAPAPAAHPDEAGAAGSHFAGRYSTPAELRESFVSTSVQLKPLQLLYMLQHTDAAAADDDAAATAAADDDAATAADDDGRWKRVLVFTNSCRAAHRLCTLLQLLGAGAVAELSSWVPGPARRQALSGLTAGRLRVLVCSDGAARGLDVPQVDAVVCYDIAAAARSYIHRVGRTARAGRPGQAVTILAHEQRRHFERVLAAAGKRVEQLQQLPAAAASQLAQYEQRYREALQQLRDTVGQEEEEEQLAGRRGRQRKRRRHTGTPAAAAAAAAAAGGGGGGTHSVQADGDSLK